MYFNSHTSKKEPTTTSNEVYDTVEALSLPNENF